MEERTYLTKSQRRVLELMPIARWQVALHRARSDVLSRLADEGLIVWSFRDNQWELTADGRTALRDDRRLSPTKEH